MQIDSGYTFECNLTRLYFIFFICFDFKNPNNTPIYIYSFVHYTIVNSKRKKKSKFQFNAITKLKICDHTDI